MSHASCQSLLRTGTVVGYCHSGLNVDVSTSVSCQKCAEGQGCGMGLLARRQQQRIVLKPSCPASEYAQRFPLQSQVTFTLSKSDLSALALWVYALPLLLSLLLLGVGAWWGMSELASVAVFFSSLLGSVLILKYRLRRNAEHFRPKLVNESFDGSP